MTLISPANSTNATTPKDATAASHPTASHPTPLASGERLTRIVAILTAAVATVGALALLVMFATEMDDSTPHVFGPISDMAGLAYNLLFAVVVVALRGWLPATNAGSRTATATLVACLVAAPAGPLLVVDILSFVASTAITVAALCMQTWWLWSVTRHERSAGRIGRALAAIGWWMPILQLVSAVVVGAAFLLPAESVPQYVVLGAGLIPGLVAWCAWPVWFALLARRLGR